MWISKNKRKKKLQIYIFGGWVGGRQLGNFTLIGQTNIFKGKRLKCIHVIEM